MPTYFFHLRQSGSRFDDEEGQLLRDADEAWEMARATARTLMAGDPSRRDVWIATSFEVTDEDGGIVLEFPFGEATEPKGELN
jgi:hypothetical protein